MKNIIVVLFAFTSLCFNPSLCAQGFTPPAEGNAAVYFVRVSNIGLATSIEYFHNEKFIGAFKGKNYMRYEVRAGKHLLWASAPNKEFVECELGAGKTYIIQVIIPTSMKAVVKVKPVTVDNKDFKKMKKLVLSKSPKVTSEEQIEKIQNKIVSRGFVENVMEKYNTIWKDKDVIYTMSEDMFIPEEYLKKK